MAGLDQWVFMNIGCLQVVGMDSLMVRNILLSTLAISILVWDWKEGTVSYSLNLERGPITNLQVDARKITVTCLDQGIQNELVVVDFAAEIN